VDLRQLRYFVTIVQSGSLSAASRQLHVAQPALSHHLKRLEQEFGVRLLRREARGVQMTREGEHFFRHAVGLLRQADNLRNAMTASASAPRGSVAVGLPRTVAGLLALPIFERALTSYPQLSLEVADGHSGELGRAVVEGRLDFAMIMPPGPSQGSVEIPLVAEELVVACPLSAPWLPATRTLSLAQLSHLPMLMSNRRERLYGLLAMLTAERRIQFDIRGHIDELRSCLAAVAAGHGATILPWSAVQGDARRGEIAIRRIRGLRPTRQLMLCRSQALPLSAAATAIATLVRDLCREWIAAGRWAGARTIEADWEHFVR
jgi:LysR family nitrogen assimilation transcriptional regulator